MLIRQKPETGIHWSQHSLHVLMASRQSILQKAFRNRDKKMAKKVHTKKMIEEAIDHPDQHQSSGKYVSDAVYGALDGIVTTFAIVSGVVGADLNPSIILILGFANLLGDGISMAAGSYLSEKSEQDYHRQEYEREKWEVENFPKAEKEEIRQIYKRKGFKGKQLEEAVETITSDKDRWIDTMMVEELGIIEENKSPNTVALTTLTAFVVCGFLPLLAFVFIHFVPSFDVIPPFTLSIIITSITIFVVGALRSLFIAKKWFVAGMEMLLVGGFASAVAYIIGYLLKGLGTV